jgi:hypothetical protein
MSAFDPKRTWRNVGHAIAGELDRGLSLFSWPARLRDLQRYSHILTQHHRADSLMDTDCTKDLSHDEARAALDALIAKGAPVTARETVEILKLKRALEAKAEERIESRR